MGLGYPDQTFQLSCSRTNCLGGSSIDLAHGDISISDLFGRCLADRGIKGLGIIDIFDEGVDVLEK